MQNDKSSNNLYNIIVGDFKNVPLTIRIAAAELKSKPLWNEIGRALINIPTDEKVDNARLRNRIRGFVNQNAVGYMEIEQTLDIMEKEGYICIKRSSAPVYYPTSKLIQGLDFIDKLEKDTINVIASGIEEMPEGRKYQNLLDLIRSHIYSALKESTKP